MKKILTAFIAIMLLMSLFAGSASAADIPIAKEHEQYWTDCVCCDPKDATKSADPVLELTFSEDGTQLKKAAFKGYFTYKGSGSALNWFGSGFGISASDKAYYAAYLFENRSAGASNSTSAETYLDDAFIAYNFRSNNAFSNSDPTFETLVVERLRGNIVEIKDSCSFSKADNAKLNPNQTYYVNFIVQGWGGLNSQWGMIGNNEPVSFKLSDDKNFRYSVNFDFQGYGGENFTMPVKKNETVDKSDARLNPTSDERIFKGWYTEPECRKKADFSKPITDNVTYYAKWVENNPVPKTGDTTPVLLMMGLALTAGAGFVYLNKRRKSY